MILLLSYVQDDLTLPWLSSVFSTFCYTIVLTIWEKYILHTHKIHHISDQASLIISELAMSLNSKPAMAHLDLDFSIIFFSIRLAFLFSFLFP